MKKKRTQTKMWIMALALGLLIVVSGIQAAELTNLKNTIGELSGSEAIKPVTQGSAVQSTLQKNIQNLPSMVGGC